MLVDELRLPVSNEQKRIAVEPGHGALEPNAAGQKDRDRHIVLAHMLQEGVLESVRMRCSHDRSPWTPHTCWPTVPLSAQRPTPEHHSARVPCTENGAQAGIRLPGSLRVSGASTSHRSAGAELCPGAWLSDMRPDTSNPDSPRANDGPAWMSRAQSSL